MTGGCGRRAPLQRGAGQPTCDGGGRIWWGQYVGSTSGGLLPCGVARPAAARL